MLGVGQTNRIRLISFPGRLNRLSNWLNRSKVSRRWNRPYRRRRGRMGKSRTGGVCGDRSLTGLDRSKTRPYMGAAGLGHGLDV